MRLTYGMCADGGVIQIGWEDAGITDSSVRGLDVIRAEWYRTEGSPSNHNDAVLSLPGRAVDAGLEAVGDLRDLAAAFRQGTVKTTFVNYAAQLSGGNKLAVAELSQVEIYTRTESSKKAPDKNTPS